MGKEQAEKAAHRNGWVNRPPSVGYAGLRVAAAAVGSPLECVAVSPHWWGRWVHWVGDRDLPCLADAGDCPESVHGLPLAWKAWFAALLLPHCQVAVLAQVSYDAARNCPELVALSEGGRLRGTFVRLTRTQSKKTGRVRAEILDPRPLRFELPSPPDVARALEAIWWRDERFRAIQGEQLEGGGDDED